QIAPRTYWARRSRPPSRQAVRDAALAEILAGIYEPDENGRRPPECLYGSVKMWEQLNREGIPVARCTVERLMRAHGWRGMTRARAVRTTVADPAHGRDASGHRFPVLDADITLVPDGEPGPPWPGWTASTGPARRRAGPGDRAPGRGRDHTLPARPPRRRDHRSRRRTQQRHRPRLGQARHVDACLL